GGGLAGRGVRGAQDRGLGPPARLPCRFGWAPRARTGRDRGASSIGQRVGSRGRDRLGAGGEDRADTPRHTPSDNSSIGSASTGRGGIGARAGSRGVGVRSTGDGGTGGRSRVLGL